MAKKKRQNKEQQEPKEETRKQQRINARDRERNQKLMLGVGIVVGLVVLIVGIGLISEFVIKPNSAVATVNDERISTRDFWKRSYLQEAQLQSQYVQLQQLEQQFGGQNFFTSQLNQIEATLSSPYALGAQVLDLLVEEKIVEQEAAARGLTVTEEEVEAAIREEVAASTNSVTEPQATSTAEAGIEATATAELWTPTPTATIDLSSTLTTTLDPPTVTPLPLLTQDTYQEGLTELEGNLNEVANISLPEYREIIRIRLLSEKLAEEVAAENVVTTEKQVRARHILLSETAPPDTADAIIQDEENDAAEVEGDADPADDATADAVDDEATEDAVDEEATEDATADAEGDADAADDTSADDATADADAEGEDATEDATADAEGDADAADDTSADGATADADAEGEDATEDAAADAEGDADAADDTSADDAAADDAAEGDEATEDAAADATADVTADDADTGRTLAEARILAEELRQRILDGEDFTVLAAEYSDDLSNAASGGDLGWFGSGMMVEPFEEEAFSLAVGEISEPVETQFGIHLIEVLEIDEERPRDESAIAQESQQAFVDWLQEKTLEYTVDHGDLQQGCHAIWA